MKFKCKCKNLKILSCFACVSVCVYICVRVRQTSQGIHPWYQAWLFKLVPLSFSSSSSCFFSFSDGGSNQNLSLENLKGITGAQLVEQKRWNKYRKAGTSVLDHPVSVSDFGFKLKNRCLWSAAFLSTFLLSVKPNLVPVCPWDKLLEMFVLWEKQASGVNLVKQPSQFCFCVNLCACNGRGQTEGDEEGGWGQTALAFPHWHPHWRHQGPKTQAHAGVLASLLQQRHCAVGVITQWCFV